MRIAIVNDLPIAVETLKNAVASVPGYQIAWIAVDGKDAVDKCSKDLPDLILMDLIMPVMDGVEATRQIMISSPCPILIVTASVRGNSPKVFAAMGFGALDAVKTPKLGTDKSAEGVRQLLDKISSIEKIISKEKKSYPPINNIVLHEKPDSKIKTLIAIGSSTGGPKALAKILSELPADFKFPVVIIQHVDESFAPGLVNWLGGQTQLNVKIAEAGTSLKPGIVYVAGKNHHLILKPNLTFGYIAEPEDYPYKPSVDVFFKSAVQNWPGKIIGVLLTGMGRDGAEGLLSIRRANMHTIAQDESSSIVYGMPKAAVEISAAVKVLHLDDIAKEILKLA